MTRALLVPSISDHYLQTLPAWVLASWCWNSLVFGFSNYTAICRTPCKAEFRNIEELSLHLIYPHFLLVHRLQLTPSPYITPLAEDFSGFVRQGSSCRSLEILVLVVMQNREIRLKIDCCLYFPHIVHCTEEDLTLYLILFLMLEW